VAPDPPVSMFELRRLIATHYGIPMESFQVHRYHPGPPDGKSFLSWMTCSGSSMTLPHRRQCRCSSSSISACSFVPVLKAYSVMSQSSSEPFLLTRGSFLLQGSYSRQPTQTSKPPAPLLPTLTFQRFTVSTWCIHPDLIPREKILFVPEPEELHV
jgi:hypothetical protein